jgi:hypothetical protein
MNPKKLLILLVGLLLLAGSAGAQTYYELLFDIEPVHDQGNIIRTNLDGTGEEFTVGAMLLKPDNTLITNPDHLFLVFSSSAGDYGNFHFCEDDPLIGVPIYPDVEIGGIFYWTNLRLPAGSVQADEPFNFRGIFEIYSEYDGFADLVTAAHGDANLRTMITIASPDITGRDGNVNLSDIALFSQYLNGALPYSPHADLNGDGTFNLSDIVLFTPAIGSTCGGTKMDVDPQLVEKLLGVKGAIEETSFDTLKSMYR